jgi:IclR family transcriptional regulator, KDG regulon repressor
MRARGYATEDGEHDVGSRCVAASIRNSAGRAFAAISVTGSAKRIGPDRIPKLAELVKWHAASISAQLGWDFAAPPVIRRRTTQPAQGSGT